MLLYLIPIIILFAIIIKKDYDDKDKPGDGGGSNLSDDSPYWGAV